MTALLSLSKPPTAVLTSNDLTAIGALRSGGRLVVNAVTLATEALLLDRHAALSGELIRVAIARAGLVGEKSGWRPAMPVTQWVWTKP